MNFKKKKQHLLKKDVLIGFGLVKIRMFIYKDQYMLNKNVEFGGPLKSQKRDKKEFTLATNFFMFKSIKI